MRLTTLLFTLAVRVVAAMLQPLPPIDWISSASYDKPFTLPKHGGIVYISIAAASTRDVDGLTLIPPSTLEFAHTFASDLPGQWTVKQVRKAPKSGIYLDVTKESGWSHYQSGVHTSEGYDLTVSPKLVTITGAGARGVWWGTRTLLQQLALGKLEPGSTRDVPAYPTRGYLLDAGRKYYSAEFLKELCSYASFFKLNEFHYHISDNYPLNRGQNKTWTDVYSHFSLLAEKNTTLQQLVHGNEAQSLTREQFDDLQSHCAARGVAVIPEIESPGHALAITKWLPQLALPKHDLLNLSHPLTLPTVESIWAEFLPWFKVKEVHIGADEYDATLADDYVNFVNALSTFVRRASGGVKGSRIWGTREPSTIPLNKDIVIQHWQYGESDPVLLHNSNTSIINSEDFYAYISVKNDHMPILPARYPQWFNTSRITSAGPGLGQWEPRIYNPFNTSEPYQLPADAKTNRGAIIAAWNDNGPVASTQLEAYYSYRSGLPVAAARMWSGSRGPKVEKGLESVEKLVTASPGHDLDRKKVKTPFTWRKGHAKLPDGSKGMDYTLTLQYSSAFELSSPDAKLELLQNGTLRFSADGYNYPLQSINPSDGYDPGHPGRIWANATSSTHEEVKIPTKGTVIIKTDEVGGSRVWTKSDGGKESFKGRFEVFVYGGRNTIFSWSQMAFVAPLGEVKGGLDKIALVDGI